MGEQQHCLTQTLPAVNRADQDLPALNGAEECLCVTCLRASLRADHGKALEKMRAPLRTHEPTYFGWWGQGGRETAAASSAAIFGWLQN